MLALVKRFRYLIETYFLLHAVNDVSPYRSRQREVSLSRLRDGRPSVRATPLATDSAFKRADVEGSRAAEVRVCLWIDL